jgi:23S rRNA pseudouridine2605 synthase
MPPAYHMPLERLQKIIARAGISSRRAAERLISGGRVRVNGKVVTELGAKADPRKDRVEVDGDRLFAEDLVYVVLHKPRSVMCTLDDPEGRPTVADLVTDVGARLFPVGRLDFGTSGVLLMSNDGELSQGLLHPKQKVPKIYVVKLDAKVDEDELDAWRNGIELDDGLTLPADVRLLRHERGKAWLQITLQEGRNQQIRRMAAARGFLAMRLARTAFAGISADTIKPGRWRVLTIDEMKKLKRAYGVPKRIRAQHKLADLAFKLEKKAKKNRGTKRQGSVARAVPKRGTTTKRAPAKKTTTAKRSTAERSDRSETKPRATDRRAARDRGRGRR